MNKTLICIDYVPYYNRMALQNPLLIEQKILQIAHNLIQWKKRKGEDRMYQEISLKTDLMIYAHTRSDEPDIDYRMHCHNSYEIYYMITGNVEYLLEGRPVRPRPGTLIVIAPDCFHGLKVLDGQPYHRLRLHMVPELLGEKERELLLAPFRRGWSCFQEQFSLEWYFQAVENCREYEGELQDIAIRASVLSLFTRIFAISKAAPGNRGQAQTLAQEVIDYIGGHLTEPLTLEGLARDFFVSKNHLTAAFKKATGTTVASYILYKRMAMARKAMGAGAPAAQAAAMAGFGDYSSFFRAYKKMFGCAPSDKRAKALPDMDQSGAF